MRYVKRAAPSGTAPPGDTAFERSYLAQPGNRPFVVLVAALVVALLAAVIVYHLRLVNPFFVGVAAAYALRLALRPARRFTWLTRAGSAANDLASVIGWLIAAAIYAGLGEVWR